MTHSLIFADRTLSGSRDLDAAKGILVALRRCTLSEAFTEILAVSTEYQVGALSVAQALVQLAEDRHPSTHSTPADEAAHRAWARLFGRV
jgi:AmiR/NasT family two-component response regulator